MDDNQIEAEIQAKGLNVAPRVTPADIDAAIKHQYFFTAGDGVTLGNQPVASELTRLTFCVLVLHNGFTITGESACASPENFDAELGRKLARAKAIDKLWGYLGFALRERLHAAEKVAEACRDSAGSLVNSNRLAAIARKFIDDNRVSCPEATTNDRVYENAPELVENLAGVVGFFKYPEDE